MKQWRHFTAFCRQGLVCTSFLKLPDGTIAPEHSAILAPNPHNPLKWMENPRSSMVPAFEKN